LPAGSEHSLSLKLLFKIIYIVVVKGEKYRFKSKNYKAFIVADNKIFKGSYHLYIGSNSLDHRLDHDFSIENQISE